MTAIAVSGTARRRIARLVPAGSTVLDVGCGDFRKAYAYVYATKPGLRVIGLERFSESTIYGASRIAPEIEATGAFRRLACDIEHDAFPLDDASVDAIFCSHVIEHVANKPQLVSEMNRVLRPGGWVYIETPSPRSRWMPRASPLQKIADPAGYPLNFADDDSHVGEPLSAAQLAEFASATGWDVRRAGNNRELGVGALPLYAAMFVAGLLPVWPPKLRGVLVGAGWWNLIGWPMYVLARKPSSPEKTARRPR